MSRFVITPGRRAKVLEEDGSRYAVVGDNVYEFVATGATAAITGTATASITESDVVTGGKTIIITLTGDTFKAAGTGPIGSTADSNALLAGIDSAQAEATGWDAEVKANLSTTDLVRTSGTVATVTLPASASYDITAQETITVTVPTAVLNTGASAIVATPTFTVDVDSAQIPIFMYHYMHNLKR